MKKLLVIGTALCALTGFAVRSSSSEKLTISFWIWGLFDAEEGGVYQKFEKAFTEALARDYDKYLAKLKACVEDACAVKREIQPQAELAMSEGATYCVLCLELLPLRGVLRPLLEDAP